MNFFDFIKGLFRRNKIEQIEAPNVADRIINKDRGTKENWRVEEEKLDIARKEQKKQKDRNHQLMFAIKNVCGQGTNLYGDDLKFSLENMLYEYGYDNEIQLSELDLAVLNRMNLDSFNNKEVYENIVDYILKSKSPSETAAELVGRVEEEAIKLAKENGCLEEVASGYISYPMNTIIQTIEEMQEAENSDLGHGQQ